MKLSVFTPTHNPQHLRRLEASLKKQTCGSFEWIIVPNCDVSLKGDWHNAKIIPSLDHRSIGALKKFACEQASGDILVEVDHDDELFPTALEEVAHAFETPHIDFVYSNSCDLENGKPHRFSSSFGWKYRKAEFEGNSILETVAFKATPTTLSQIWFCPNHIRAWRRSFYEKIGGHQDIVLDDQDLLCRTYIHGTMHHIDKPLYVYHIHDSNSYKDITGNVVNASAALFDKYIRDMVKKWCEINLLHFVKSDGTFFYRDREVGAFVIEDIELSQKMALREINRCLADGGWVFANIPTRKIAGLVRRSRAIL